MSEGTIVVKNSRIAFEIDSVKESAQNLVVMLLNDS